MRMLPPNSRTLAVATLLGAVAVVAVVAVGTRRPGEPGDVVVASGSDGVYPKGFPIGKVEKSDRGSGLYRQITVRPAVDFTNVEDLLIILVPAKYVSAKPEPAAPAERPK